MSNIKQQLIQARDDALNAFIAAFFLDEPTRIVQCIEAHTKAHKELAQALPRKQGQTK